MEQNDFMEIDLHALLHLMFRRWWIILLAGLLIAGLALTYTSLFITPIYQANADLYVNSATTLGGELDLTLSTSSISASRSLIDTYTVILTSRLTLEEVIEKADLPYSYSELKKMVTSAGVNNTEVLRITVTSSDPDESRRIANTIVEVLPKQIAKIVHGSSVEVVDLAVTPSAAFSPNYQRNTLIGFVAGIFISAVAVVLMEFFFHDSIEDTEWLKTTFSDKIPVLATIPAVGAKGEKYGYGKKYGYGYGYGYRRKKEDASHYYTSQNENTIDKKKDKKVDKSDSYVTPFGDKLSFISSEAYNRLRSNLNFVCPVKENGGRIIGVTSGNPQEGKSYTAINLCYTLAKEGHSVLLLDADLRRPSIAKSLSLPQAPGLSNILTGKPDNTIHRGILHPKLSVVTSGDIPPNPSELLGSATMGNVLSFFADNYDFVVVDLPPINAVIDPVAVSSQLDGILFVVRHASSKRREVLDAMQQLEFINTKVLGFVYNGYSQGHGYYSHRSGKYKGYQYGKKYGYGYGYYGRSSEKNETEKGKKTEAEETAKTAEPIE